MEKTFKQILFIFLLIFGWQFAYSVLGINSPILPSPNQIIRVLWEVLLSGEILRHILSSLLRVTGGFLAAMVTGVVLGVLFSYYKGVGDYFKPIIEILRPIPPIAWIPIAILVFGLGNYSAFFIVFLGAFFPIFTNTYFGASSIPEIYQNISKTFELSRFKYLIKVLFFYSLPNIFTGLKIGMGMAWICVIAAEMIGAQSGLGYFIQINRLLLHTDKILAGMTLIGAIGFLLNSIITFIERKIIKWEMK